MRVSSRRQNLQSFINDPLKVNGHGSRLAHHRLHEGPGGVVVADMVLCLAETIIAINAVTGAAAVADASSRQRRRCDWVVAELRSAQFFGTSSQWIIRLIRAKAD